MYSHAFFCSTWVLVASLLPWVALGAQSKACYFPHGVDANTAFNVTEGWYFAPCNKVANVSMCCATGPGRNSSADVCRPDGLCYNNAQAAYWRESCTDPTWTDAACIKLFVNGSNGDADARLTSCPDGSWCSGANNTGCCQAKQGVLLSSLQTHPTSANATANTTTTATTSPNTTSPTATTPLATPTASSHLGLSGGAKIGVGVGVTMAALLIIVLVAFVLFRRRHSRHARFSETDGASRDSRDLTPRVLRSVKSTDSAVAMQQPGTATYAATVNGRAITNGKSPELRPSLPPPTISLDGN